MNDPRHKPSVMRTLGLTLGDLWSVLKTGKTKPPTRQTVRTSTSEETRETEQGSVTLRRTVIEEIEVRPPQQAARADEDKKKSADEETNP